MNPFELPKDLLHEVIIRTIEVDNLSNNIIRTAFGLEIDRGGEDGSMPLNLKEIYRFNEYFLENFGSSPRADLLLEIVKDICEYNKEEQKICKDFKGKLIEFYKIRNIFAHNIYPKDLKGKTKLDSSVPHWIELNRRHNELFVELRAFLQSNCFKEAE